MGYARVVRLMPAYVRANPEQARKKARNLPHSCPHEKLRDADHVRNDLDFNFYTPLPPMQDLWLANAECRIGLRGGKTELAIDATCQISPCGDACVHVPT